MYVHAKREGKTGAPLVFTFHGTGGSETQFHSFAANLLPDATVISPRGDVSEMGAARFFRRTGEGVYDMADLGQRTAAMAGFMAEAAAQHDGPVYAFGYSNGANILASVMMQRPDLVGRAALLHPLIPWSPEPVAELAGTQVLITAGERDPICPAPLTRQLSAWFDEQGAEVDMVWHPGGHEITQAEVDALSTFLAH
ncbi:alpha/beta hydrolase [Pontivivens insulae]|uniref:Hydrolase MhqD n=1 Tax=Pontivivens insulae TaxID=1639689 RepID=A0A2R8ABW1_9RHOB|nr:alpha/beta hydrolase [Pontivivens insulae]RED11277.1 phospholipase/carboxylesterase [Pontivivens insulae]SPF29550.1 Putative hydrolase MhqD [Pontivivens insulae]